MALVHVGGLAFGSGFPLPFAIGATAALDAEAKLAACANFKLDLTLPSISAKLELAAQITAGLQAALTLGIEPPGLQLQLELMADLILKLQAELSLYLQLMNLGGLSAQFYAWHGAANAAGGALATEWASGLPGGGGGSEVIDAAIIATNAGPVYDGLSQIVKMVP